MFAWGSTIHGELGIGGIEDEHIQEPIKLHWSLAHTVIEAALSDSHTLFLTDNGKVYSCGNNDFGQLGHSHPRKRPQPVSGLDAHHIVHIACGDSHSLALNQWGQVLSWGSDSQGQLGHLLGDGGLQPSPRIVKALSVYHLVQIACGKRHSVALANSGEILVWGDNIFGQLGLGYKSPPVRNPEILKCLCGIPIAFISCGGFHSFVVSKSGAVYGWGKNQHGQLGLNHTEDKYFPCQLRTLRNIRVRYISCGDDFSTFLTLDGGVLTCGSGTYGQLGHGTKLNAILPRQVVELMGSTITQISCGRQHALSFIPSRGRVYSFGLGSAGQLGLGNRKVALAPQVVLGPWASPSGATLFPATGRSEAQDLLVRRIFAGGDHCFVTVMNRVEGAQPYDCRLLDPLTQVLVIDEQYLQEAVKARVNNPVDQELLTYLETVFKSLSCFNGSFLIANDGHFYCTSRRHGVDLEVAEKAFSLIGKIEHPTIKELIWNCIVDGILKNLVSNPPDVETLRIYLTLPLYHEFYNPRHYIVLHKPFVSALLNLRPNPNKVVKNWLKMTSADYFEKLVQKFKMVVSYILRAMDVPRNKTVFTDPNLVAMLEMLDLLNKMNCGTHGLKVPYETFHLTDLNDYIEIKSDYIAWLFDHSPPKSGKLYLCDYPFIFDAQSKTTLLETDQLLQMENAMQIATHQALIALLLDAGRRTQMPVNQFLRIQVSRDNLIEDTLQELEKVDPRDLKKPLKVKFKGEEAEDAGGVSKEFFMLVLRGILNPDYGMFKEYETRVVWFCRYTGIMDETLHYHMLIGMVVGLAIYNFTIINVPFPLALYKKILGESVVLEDLKSIEPSIAHSLQQVLDSDDPEFFSTIDMCFEISYNELGIVDTVELKPNGKHIPVTVDNKEEYVNLYLDQFFHRSVERQFEAFKRGFMKVMSGRVLKLFHSHELMAVVVGNENYDWHALEEVAEYKNGYRSSDQTIRWFWEVLHEMSLQDKKKFLLFLTGSDRIPIKGMKAIKIVIQPTADDKYLPVAHTCFNLLDLPRYRTKERLRYKLLQAIQQTEGFSLV